MTPAFHITANSSDVTNALQSRLLSLRVVETLENKAAWQFAIELDDRDQKAPVLPLGADISMSLGYEEVGLVDQGKWRVDEYELRMPPRALVIKGRTADTASPKELPRFKGGKSRPWQNITLGTC